MVTPGARCWSSIPTTSAHAGSIETPILALAEHRPATGRIEALNNNWETLVRRARGYRDHQYLLRKLRFMVANPIRTNDGLKRFIALGLTPPIVARQAA
jgi:hypothetical protein